MEYNHSLFKSINPVIAILEDYFNDAKRRNAKYSLRAMAQKLDIPHSTLSDLLNNKKLLTSNLIKKIGEGLKIPDEQLDSFLEYYYLEPNYLPKTPIAREIIDVDESNCAIVTDWKISAILELVGCSFCQGTIEWIANTLNITQDDVLTGIKLLQDFKLVEFSDGVVRRRKEFSYLLRISKSLKDHKNIVKEFHLGLGRVAASEEVQQKIDWNKQAALICRCSKKDFDLIKRLSDRFILKAHDILETSEHPADSVYAMTINFFPLTK